MLKTTHTQRRQRRIEIAEFIQNNPDLRQIDVAKVFNCSQSTIVKAVFEFGHPKGKGHGTVRGVEGMLKRQLIRDALREHPDWTKGKIAEYLGVTYWQVDHQLDVMGISRKGLKGRQPGFKMQPHVEEKLRAGYRAWQQRQRELKKAVTMASLD